MVSGVCQNRRHAPDFYKMRLSCLRYKSAAIIRNDDGMVFTVSCDARPPKKTGVGQGFLLLAKLPPKNKKRRAFKVVLCFVNS